MGGFFDANYTITKLSKNAKGEITHLEINHKEVPVNAGGFGLYDWKYSSSHIYTKELFTESVDNVTTYGGNPLTKATTGDYVAAHTNDVWTYSTSYFTDELESTTEPDGTAGTAVTIGKAYIATAEDTDLTEGTWYTVVGTGATAKYYEVAGLSKTALVLGDEVTGADAKTAIAAATLVDVKYKPYAEGEYILYSSHKYYRYSDGDIIL